MFSVDFLKNFSNVLSSIDYMEVEDLITKLMDLRANKGRLFILGVGGSSANASHAVNDFRKLANIETYAPTDIVSELTARTNDEGWNTVFIEWLKTSRCNSRDAVLVLSVGGGNLEKNVSSNLVYAAKYVQSVGGQVFGIVGRDGGEIRKISNSSILIPTLVDSMVTPFAEAAQSVILHLIISHPGIARNATKW